MDKIHLIKNIINYDECKYLSELFDAEKIKRKSNDNPIMTNNSYGFGTRNVNSYGFGTRNVFDDYMNILKKKVLQYFSNNTHKLLNVNTYVREYVNDSFLKKHVDRPDINVTLSICLYSNINKTWPLIAEIDGHEYSFDTQRGDGILLIDSDKITHWRNELICNKNERVIQFFLHWRYPNSALNKSLI
jgi:hypothetical protein